MQNLVNKTKDEWVRPWNRPAFDQLSEKDDRFIAILMKGVLSWLTRHIVMYGKPIKHFIFNTGSSYLYIENDGYEYSLSETSGEDTMYMSMPRCICELENISVLTEDLSQPFIRGVYERYVGNEVVGMNAEMMRLPLVMNVKCKYVLSNFNESIVLIEEILSKLVFQQYFRIVYLGQTIQCSIEYPTEESIEINKIDMASSETNQKTIEISLKVNANYPKINERSEMRNDQIIGSFKNNLDLHKDLDEEKIDRETYTIQ